MLQKMQLISCACVWKGAYNYRN